MTRMIAATLHLCLHVKRSRCDDGQNNVHRKVGQGSRNVLMLAIQIQSLDSKELAPLPLDKLQTFGNDDADVTNGRSNKFCFLTSLKSRRWVLMLTSRKCDQPWKESFY